MGYTHYWYAGPNTDAWLSSWPQLVADAQLIIDKAPVKVQRDEDDPRPPLVDKEAGIRFNGADWSHETFIMPKILNRFDFCKTLSKPYDVVVATILLRASVLGKDGIEVASDGWWEDDWLPARELYKSIWPEENVTRAPWADRYEREEAKLKAKLEAGNGTEEAELEAANGTKEVDSATTNGTDGESKGN